MKPRPCRCGHARSEHSHHRRGTDCSTCGIACLRYRPAVAVAWIVAVFVTAAVLLAVGVALTYVLILNGWWLAAAGTLAAAAAATSYYNGIGYCMVAEHHATLARLDARAHNQRRRHLASVARHPSSRDPRSEDWDRALVELIANHHRRDAA